MRRSKILKGLAYLREGFGFHFERSEEPFQASKQKKLPEVDLHLAKSLLESR